MANATEVDTPDNPALVLAKRRRDRLFRSINRFCILKMAFQAVDIDIMFSGSGENEIAIL